MATASASVRRVEQGYVELVGRLGAASAACDFQHAAMHWAAFVGTDLMHDTVIATAKAFPAIPEMGAAGRLQCIGEHRVPH